MIDDSGKARVGWTARCIFALILVVGIAVIVFGVIAVQREPGTVRGSQALPGQVADQLGQAPKPAAPKQ